MSLRIIRGDITQLEVDAIVCPTDGRFSGGGGTDIRIGGTALSKRVIVAGGGGGGCYYSGYSGGAGGGS